MLGNYVSWFIRLNHLLRGMLYYWLSSNIGKGFRLGNPIQLRNFSYAIIGKRVRIREHFRLELANATSSFRIGNDVNIEQNVHIICSNKVFIGNNCTITANCALVDIDHVYSSVEKIGNTQQAEKQDIIIGDNVFIGMGTIILGNSSIGKNSIVGANSVLRGHFPNNSLISGNPATLIKYNTEE
jgi:acetyltransferase-like isoleucine patch superfamily enzyme